MSYTTKAKTIPVDQISNNPWNPNRMKPVMYQRAKNSLTKFGTVQRILVRKVGDRFQVIDGEHRLKAAKDLRWKKIKCEVIQEKVSEEDARLLTLALGDIHGENDADAYAVVLSEIMEGLEAPDVLDILPMEEVDLNQYLGLLEVDSKEEDEDEEDEEEDYSQDEDDEDYSEEEEEDSVQQDEEYGDEDDEGEPVTKPMNFSLPADKVLVVKQALKRARKSLPRDIRNRENSLILICSWFLEQQQDN